MLFHVNSFQQKQKALSFDSEHTSYCLKELSSFDIFL